MGVFAVAYAHSRLSCIHQYLRARSSPATEYFPYDEERVGCAEEMLVKLSVPRKLGSSSTACSRK